MKNLWNIFVRIEWLMLIATIVTLFGWFALENPLVQEYGFYFRLLTLPLLLACMAGALPGTAPFNPNNSEKFWEVASVSFKLFVLVTAVMLVLFVLNDSK